jgi:hypothetical protein
MCLAPSICSLDVVFFDEGTTTNNSAQIQKQYLSPMSLGICLSELAMQDITKSVYYFEYPASSAAGCAAARLTDAD